MQNIYDRRTRNSLWNPEFMDSRCDLLSFYNDPVTIQHPYPERCFCIRIIQLYKEVFYEQTNDLRYIQHFISESCLCSELCFCCQPERRGRAIGRILDTICEDPMFGTDTWEAAESTLQKQAALLAIKKTASPVPIYSFFLQATCWLRHQPLLSEPLI